jgi:putative spermidine/putrescine transport system permease protein
VANAAASRAGPKGSSRRHLALAGLLVPPMAWLVVAYLGALAAILATAVWSTDPFTNQVVRTFTTENLRALADPIYLRIIGRTLLIAVLVTAACVLIAVPFAFFMAKVVPVRWRRVVVALVLVPLWASYLVKAYAWRSMVAPGGVLDSVLGGTPGYGLAAVVITLTYLWLPYMVLPVYAGFERLPDSHLEASADLGAGNLRTFWRIALPALRPAIAAGSVFTFSLSLGDYIAVQIVGGKVQVLGTAVLQNITLDLPFAAALGSASVLIMVGYLLAVRRAGALDNL